MNSVIQYNLLESRWARVPPKMPVHLFLHFFGRTTRRLGSNREFRALPEEVVLGKLTDEAIRLIFDLAPNFYQSRASFWYPTWPAFLLWFAQVRSHTRSCLYYAYRTLTTSNIWLHITYVCTLEDYLFLHKSDEEPLEKKLG